MIANLRERGVRRLDELRYVLYETKGELTIVREDDAAAPETPLVEIALRDATGWPPG